MPLNWTQISFPLVAGLQELADDFILQPPGAIQMLNARPEGMGRWGHRYGFTRQSAAITNTLSPSDPSTFSAANLKSIFSTRQDLCVITDHYLINYVDNRLGWHEKGFAPVGHLTSQVIEGSSASTSCVQVAHTSNSIVMVWQVGQQSSTATYVQPECFVKVTDKDGGEIIAATSLGTQCVSPTVVPITESGTFDDGVIIAWIDFTSSGNMPAAGTNHSGQVKYQTYQDGASGFGTTTALTTATEARIPGDNQYGRHVDVVSIDGNGDAAFVWIADSTGDAAVDVQDVNDHATDHSITQSMTGDVCCVSICHNPDDSKIMIHIGNDTATGGNSTTLVEYNEDLTGGSTGVGFSDEATSALIFSVGIEYGTARSTDMYCIVSHMRGEGFPGAPSNVAKYRFCTAPFTAVGSQDEIWGAGLITQPFFINDHCYVGLQTDLQHDGFDHAFITDLNPYAHDDIGVPCMVAGWDLGFGQNTFSEGVAAEPYDLGTPCTVSIDTKDVYFATMRTVEFKVPLIEREVRLQGVWHKLDFDAKVKGVKVHDGTAVIPGSVCAWYDGSNVTELGWLSPPYIRVLSTQGGSLTDTYNVKQHWEYVDKKGFLHRSPVSNTRSGALTSESILPRTHTTPGTMRNVTGSEYHVETHLVSYLSDSNDAKFRKITEVGELIQNRYRTSAIVDNELISTVPAAGSRQEVVYTQDGIDLDAINPGACSAAAVVRDRLWVLGFNDKDRAMYSDSLDSPAGGSITPAPEFNELLGYESRGREQLVNAARLGDKVILFTTEGVYAIAGDGPDKSGRNNNFSGIVELSSEYGLTERDSVVEFPGGVFFKSNQGLVRLREDNLQMQLVAEVRDSFAHDATDNYDTSCHWPKEKAVVFGASQSDTGANLLLYFYEVDAWAKWTVNKTLVGTYIDMCVHDDELWLLTSNGPLKYDRTERRDNDTSSFTTVAMVWQSPWLKAAGLSEYIKTRYVMPQVVHNGGDFTLQIVMRVDYDDSTDELTSSVTTAEMALYDNSNLVDTKAHMVRRCKAFSIELTSTPASGDTQGGSFVGLDVELAKKKGSWKPNPSHRE